MDNKPKIVECPVLLERCDNSTKVEVYSNEPQTDIVMVQVKREAEECHDNTVAVDWIKREHDVDVVGDTGGAISGSHVKEELEIEPMVLQPCLPVSELPMDTTAVVDRIKREQNIRENEGFNIKIELVEIEPSTPSNPAAVIPKMEPTSGIKRQSSLEEPTPGCSSTASAVSQAGYKYTELSLASTRPVKEPRGSNQNISRPSETRSHKRAHTGERPFGCTLCVAKFDKSCNLKKHMHIHTGERPFSCAICFERFTESGNLKTHMRIHTGERPFSCEICDAKFARSNDLKRHMCIHTGERPFSCTFCDAKFIFGSNLKNHIRTHTGERPFNCTVCDAKFKDSGSLKKHMNMHTGDRPFSCEICNSKFKDSGSLKKHMHVHTGNRFSCTICDAKFTLSGNLKTHMRIHTGERPFSCAVCDAKFVRSSDLKRHMRIHTRERPFSCTVCDAKFTFTSNLTRHMLTHAAKRRPV